MGRVVSAHPVPARSPVCVDDRPRAHCAQCWYLHVGGLGGWIARFILYFAIWIGTFPAASRSPSFRCLKRRVLQRCQRDRRYQLRPGSGTGVLLSDQRAERTSQFFPESQCAGDQLSDQLQQFELTTPCRLDVRHRVDTGLYLQANYTFSKVLSDADGTGYTRFDPFLNVYNGSHRAGARAFRYQPGVPSQRELRSAAGQGTPAERRTGSSTA